MEYRESSNLSPDQIIIYPFEIEGDSLVRTANRPVDLYAPFDQHAPYSDFANLDTNDHKGLLNYANTCGIPISPSLNWIDDSFAYEELRTLTKKDLLSDKYLKRLPRTPLLLESYPIKTFQREVNKMKFVLALKRIVEGDKSPDLLEMYRDYLASFDNGRPEGDFIRDKNSSAYAHLKGIINDVIRGCNVSIKRDGVSFLRSYTFPFLRHALYLTLIDDISNDIRRCANEKCLAYFPVYHEGKIYCDTRCAGLVSQRTYRRRIEAEKRKKKEKNHGKKR